jgi:prephenate dehydrogenase
MIIPGTHLRHKVLIVRQLRQVTVIGLGLLGASVALSVLRKLDGVRSVGYSHRASTRKKARQMEVADHVADDMAEAVADADLVILATPIRTFRQIMEQLCGVLREGCIVTDVGSTKSLPHKWAAEVLPAYVYYVGSHPIAGSEKRGVEFARDDLLYGADCIVTRDARTNPKAEATVRKFWSSLGCKVVRMEPGQHDRIYADVSHMPHIAAAALVNAVEFEELKYAGKGFIDTSRIASGPANIWTDILLTNENLCGAIDRMSAELARLRKAIVDGDEEKVNELLEKARKMRESLITYKMKRKEIT